MVCVQKMHYLWFYYLPHQMVIITLTYSLGFTKLSLIKRVIKILGFCPSPQQIYMWVFIFSYSQYVSTQSTNQNILLMRLSYFTSHHSLFMYTFISSRAGISCTSVLTKKKGMECFFKNNLYRAEISISEELARINCAPIPWAAKKENGLLDHALQAAIDRCGFALSPSQISVRENRLKIGFCPFFLSIECELHV